MMDLKKIGKFIAIRRKAQHLTQEQLAEKLDITGKAVSKWERGLSLPDTSIMLRLCEILKISANELLSGQKLSKQEFNTNAEKNLVQSIKKIETQNHKLIACEYVIGSLLVALLLTLIIVASFVNMSVIWRVILIVIAFLIFIFGIGFALRLEQETGFYQCKKCHHKYVPTYKAVLFAIHIGTTRYLKCPKCGQRSWNKKVLS